MRTPIFQIDAFASRRFAGNPAAVMPMASFPADAMLQEIAAENNLAETAFLVPENGDYRLRWFTPVTEVPLCGHATLASAAVVMERLETGTQHCGFPIGEWTPDRETNAGGLRHGLPASALRADCDASRVSRSAGRRSHRGFRKCLQLHGSAGEPTGPACACS